VSDLPSLFCRCCPVFVFYDLWRTCLNPQQTLRKTCQILFFFVFNDLCLYFPRAAGIWMPARRIGSFLRRQNLPCFFRRTAYIGYRLHFTKTVNVGRAHEYW